jgi:hypothetical protein
MEDFERLIKYRNERATALLNASLKKIWHKNPTFEETNTGTTSKAITCPECGHSFETSYRTDESTKETGQRDNTEEQRTGDLDAERKSAYIQDVILKGKRRTN